MNGLKLKKVKFTKQSVPYLNDFSLVLILFLCNYKKVVSTAHSSKLFKMTYIPTTESYKIIPSSEWF